MLYVGTTVVINRSHALTRSAARADPQRQTQLPSSFFTVAPRCHSGFRKKRTACSVLKAAAVLPVVT
jgi:hypothetical protein